MTPPQLLVTAAEQTRLALQQAAAELAEERQDAHQETIDSLRAAIRAAFAEYADRPTDAEPLRAGWDPSRALHDGVLGDLLADLQQALAEQAEDDADEFEEAFDVAFLEGHSRELWLLALSGIPAAQYGTSLPEDDDRLSLLLAAGVAGVGWRARLDRWRDEAAARSTQWLQASITGGRSLDDTLQGLDGILTTYDGRSRTLGTEELVRAHGIGGRLARDAVAADYALVSIWVARTTANGKLDPAVCPRCAALHLTITDLQPVTDTHPRCRCTKVSVPRTYRPSLQTYDEFLQALSLMEA